ncbi:site-specific DNA-methyltransferase [bacterium]|nr:MAG: site-specific DNA-methyltransferase [bacterium]
MQKRLEDYTKEELLKVIDGLKRNKKFGLVWEDKPEDVVQKCQTELPVLEEAPELAITALEGKPNNYIIEGDNYHALSVLNYTHAGKVDVIYADPPYNTGARDWKYNNQFVDSNDTWRHSKWLSFMEKRLRLARSLIKDDAVIVVTIDEHEVNNLGVLLAEIYPDAYIQMITIVINPKGVTQGRFSRVDEYAFFCFFGNATVHSIGDDLLTPMSEEEKGIETPRWKGLLRSGANAKREDRKNMFYPVLIDEKRKAVLDVGEPIPFEEQPDFTSKINGLTPVWPISTDGSQGRWGVGHTSLKKLIEVGYVAVGSYDAKRKTWPISYLSKQAQEQIQSGILDIISFDDSRNVVTARYTGEAERRIKTVWHRSAHDAGAYGADYLRKMLGERSFPFPKSINAVRDTLSALVKNNPDAVVLDFFAGSGTTGEAVLRINEEAGGSRTFILCTNNESNIADEVTYPRVKAVIDGFDKTKAVPANLRYFRTTFVSKKRSDDQTRAELVARSTEMICLREDAFSTVADTETYKIFEGAGNFAAIIFSPEAISEFKMKAASLDLDKALHIYVFSLSNDTYESDLADIANTHELRAIPESILEVYRRVFPEHQESIGR